MLFAMVQMVKLSVGLMICTILTSFCGVLHWIAKQSRHGNLLEQLESSGTRIMMSGPIVRQLGEHRCSEKHVRVVMDFMGFFIPHIFLYCWFTTLAKESRHTLSLFGGNCR